MMVKIPKKESTSGKTESQVQAEIRLAVGQQPDARIWRNNVGETVMVNRGMLIKMITSGDISKAIGLLKTLRPVQFGLAVGSGDLIGIVGPMGRFLSIEVKAEDGKLRPEQENWIKVVRRFGGVAGEARSVEDAMALYEEARDG